MSRRCGPPITPGLPDRVGREVVVVDVAAVLLEREVVDPLALLRRAEGQQRHDLRLPAGEERRAVGARADRHLAGDRADLLLGASVGPALVDRDLLAGRAPCRSTRRALAIVLLRRRVASPGTVRWPVPRRERQRRRSRRSGRRAGAASRDFSSFESCSASVSARRSTSNCSRTGASTAAARALLEDRLSDVRVCSSRTTSSSVELIVIAPASRVRISSTIAPAVGEARGRDRGGDLVAVARRERAR